MVAKIEDVLLNKKVTKATYITKEDLTDSEMIKSKLSDDEELIAEFIDFIYKVPEESVLGRKELFITNKGRFILYDSGGFLGTAYCYSANGIVSSFNSGICKMEMDVKGSIEIKAKVTVEDFLNLAKEIPNIKTDESKVSTVLFNEEYEYSVEIETLEEGIKIKNVDIKALKDIDINYSFIKAIDFVEENQKCIIKAYSEDNNTMQEYKFIFFSTELYEEIKEKLGSLKSNIIDIVKENSKVIKALILQQDENNKDFESDDEKKESILIINDKQIDIYDKTLENHVTFELDECSFFKNPFDEEHMFLITQLGIMQLFKKIKLEGMEFKTLKNLNNKAIIIKNDKYRLVDIEFTNNSIFLKDKSNVIDISCKEIRGINILEARNASDVKIEIKHNEDIICILDKDVYFNILQKWMAGSIGEDVNLEELITLWSRSLKEIMSFYYFSPLQEMKDILDEILEGNLEVSILKKEDRLLLINSMYRVLNVYNKAIMEFSLRLPKELLEELIGDESIEYIKEFDSFEQRVMNIYYNLNKNTERVLDNLKSLHDYIYPEVDMNKVLNKKNVKKSETTMEQYSGLDNIIKAYDLIGILKLRGTNLGTLNNRYEKVNMHGEQKINIYLNNAIIEFYNLMDFVVPKYNNDLVRITKELGEEIKSIYTNNDKEFIQSILVYNKIFIETPISTNIDKPKKEVLEKVNKKRYSKEATSKDTFKFTKKPRKEFCNKDVKEEDIEEVVEPQEIVKETKN